jgi:hypothetical protein
VPLRILDGAGAFDPFAAVLLLARPRLGVMLSVSIITIVIIRAVALDIWVGAARGFQVEVIAARNLVLILVLATGRLRWPQRRSLGLSDDVKHGISAGREK